MRALSLLAMFCVCVGVGVYVYVCGCACVQCNKLCTCVLCIARKLCVWCMCGFVYMCYRLYLHISVSLCMCYVCAVYVTRFLDAQLLVSHAC